MRALLCAVQVLIDGDRVVARVEGGIAGGAAGPVTLPLAVPVSDVSTPEALEGLAKHVVVTRGPHGDLTATVHGAPKAAGAGAVSSQPTAPVASATAAKGEWRWSGCFGGCVAVWWMGEGASGEGRGRVLFGA